MSSYSNKLFSLKIFIYLLTAAVLTAVDQWTKHLAFTRLKGNPSFVIIDGVLEFSYLQNSGAAWGMLAGHQTLFYILTAVVLIFLVYAVIKTPYTRHYAPLHVVMTLLTAGAVGNFIDRLLNGYVHDFIYFKLIDFPVFNVADSYVTVSMIIFVVTFLFVYKDEGEFDYLIPKKKTAYSGNKENN